MISKIDKNGNSYGKPSLIVIDKEGKPKTLSIIPPTTITVGTTPVTSGTDGRVFFQSGGVVQQDSSFFWDNTNKRLGVGGTPSAYRLDINGNTRISGNASTSGEALTISGDNVNVILDGTGVAGTPITEIKMRRSSATSFSIQVGSGGFNSFQIRNNNNTAIIPLHINSSNNVGIGTTSPQARLDVRAQGALSTDIAFRVRNSADSVTLTEIDGRGAYIQRSNSFTGTYTVNFSANNQLDFTHSVIGGFMRVGPSNTINFLGQRLIETVRGAQLGSTTIGAPHTLNISGIVPQSSGTTNTSGILLNYAINNTGTYVGVTRGIHYNPTLTSLTGTTHIAFENTTGDVLLNTTSGNTVIGATSPNASAKLQVDSTTQGFLPPRMTTTQRTAIASPAAGLMVYDTTLNKHYGFDGTNWDQFRNLSDPLLTNLIFVESLSDLPAPVAGVISLADNLTYFFTTVVDLLGSRIVAGVNTTILGGSSENCRIKSTGLIGTALITSNYSLPMRGITIEADVALNLNGDGVTTAIDWFGVNFTNCANVGTIANYSNFIMTDSALLSSANMIFDGITGTIGFSQCLFTGIAGQTTMSVAPTATITRRFRAIYSSFVAFGGATALNVSPLATINTEGFILDTINFSGGATYLGGLDHTSLKSLFVNCVGITNTSNVGHYRMDNNNTVTTISTTNTWTLVVGTTIEAFGNSPKFVHTNQRLTYVGAVTQDFYFSGNFTIESVSNNQTFAVTLGLNGVPQDDEAVEIRTPTANQPFSISAAAIAPLSQNDYIELYVKNLNNTNSLRVTEFNVIAQKLTG